MTKTIKQWLETLPSPIKEKALDNLIKGIEDLELESLADALGKAFERNETNEGVNYWDSVDILAEAGDFKGEEILSFPREVYVSEVSKELALINKRKRICLGKFNGQYLCVNYCDEERFNDCNNIISSFWEHIEETPKAKTLIIKTDDGQLKEISEKQAIELGFII